MAYFIARFWEAVAVLRDRNETQVFLRDLLTHTEIKMFAKRLAIAKMLLEGRDYETIEEELRVTPGTIARINNLLAEGGEGFRMVLKRLGK